LCDFLEYVIEKTTKYDLFDHRASDMGEVSEKKVSEKRITTFIADLNRYIIKIDKKFEEQSEEEAVIYEVVRRSVQVLKEKKRNYVKLLVSYLELMGASTEPALAPKYAGEDRTAGSPKKSEAPRESKYGKCC
jgi:uncharacterized protein (UPF0297 family)